MEESQMYGVRPFFPGYENSSTEAYVSKMGLFIIMEDAEDSLLSS
jgi:hypothetical protein